MAHLESLVVFDPDPRTRETLAFGFERDGYKVYATGESGDALAMAQTRVPQLVMAAIPHRNGAPPAATADTLGMIGRLREEPATRELPIVVLGERGARQSALRAGADEFVARPAFIRDVLTLSTLAVALRQDGDETGVAGMLEDYELYFLTRALSVAERSGVLELERDGRVGEVHFVKGEVVTARCGRMSGLAAFHHLLLWGEAAIQIRLTSPTGERKIHKPIDTLLSDAARFARELEAAAERIGGAQAIFRQEPRRAAEARAQIPNEVMVLLKLYDGRRPLIDLVEDSPFKALDTVKVSWRLLQLGVIERVPQTSTASPLTAQLAVRDWLLGAATDAERSTVTDVGRRAAEAYAAAQAEKTEAAERAPVVDILDDTAKVQLFARPELAVPLPVEDPPTAPREIKKGPQAQSKKRNKRQGRRPSGDTAPVAKAPEPKPAPPAPPVELRPSQPALSPSPEVDFEATIPFSRMPPELLAELEPKPAPKIEAKPAPKGEAKLPSRKPKPEAAPRTAKELAFTDAEEEFFARESELAKVHAPESFEDLEPIPETSPKRRWFGRGARKFLASTTKTPKKR
ncbi:MAG TPA: DUF4388 domain-containing protein [Polyangia bacterium]